jgi:ubiquinol-cytochrome c reductase subunit 7
MLTVCACRADDLIPEENPNVLLALKRLPEKESYDRIFRIRRAFQVSLARNI